MHIYTLEFHYHAVIVLSASLISYVFKVSLYGRVGRASWRARVLCAWMDPTHAKLKHIRVGPKFQKGSLVPSLRAYATQFNVISCAFSKKIRHQPSLQPTILYLCRVVLFSCWPVPDGPLSSLFLVHTKSTISGCYIGLLNEEWPFIKTGFLRVPLPMHWRLPYANGQCYGSEWQLVPTNLTVNCYPLLFTAFRYFNSYPLWQLNIIHYFFIYRYYNNYSLFNRWKLPPTTSFAKQAVTH